MPSYIFYVSLPEEPPFREQLALEAAGFKFIDAFHPDTLWPLEAEISDEDGLADAVAILEDWAAQHDGMYERAEQIAS